MGRITSSVGLISGIPIQDTVDKLMALQSAGRDKAVASGKVLTNQKTELLKLETLLVGLQFTSNRLTTSTLFQQRTDGRLVLVRRRIDEPQVGIGGQR